MFFFHISITLCFTAEKGGRGILASGRSGRYPYSSETTHNPQRWSGC